MPGREARLQELSCGAKRCKAKSQIEDYILTNQSSLLKSIENINNQKPRTFKGGNNGSFSSQNQDSNNEINTTETSNLMNNPPPLLPISFPLLFIDVKLGEKV